MASKPLTRAERRVLRDLMRTNPKLPRFTTGNLGTSEKLLYRMWRRGLVRIFAMHDDACRIRGVEITAAGCAAVAP